MPAGYALYMNKMLAQCRCALGSAVRRPGEVPPRDCPWHGPILRGAPPRPPAIAFVEPPWWRPFRRRQTERAIERLKAMWREYEAEMDEWRRTQGEPPPGETA